jgi:small subunit ribosomal protein S15
MPNPPRPAPPCSPAPCLPAAAATCSARYRGHGTDLAKVPQFQRHGKDSGSPEVQIARMSARVLQLTEHLAEHKKDFSTRRGLLAVLSQRKQMLLYLQVRRLCAGQLCRRSVPMGCCMHVGCFVKCRKRPALHCSGNGGRGGTSPAPRAPVSCHRAPLQALLLHLTLLPLLRFCHPACCPAAH